MRIRNTLAFAFWQGFHERRTLGDAFGRTHPDNQDWNEAYDRGANVADMLPFLLAITLAFAVGAVGTIAPLLIAIAYQGGF